MALAEFDWSREQPAEVPEQVRAPRFRPEWRPVLLGHLGMAPGMSALEVCCGAGTLAPYLADGIAPGRVTGLDPDKRLISRARDRAEQAGVRNVEYVVGNALALPFADGEFDAVTSYTGIGVLAEPERAVAEMIRVCRPGGTVSIMEPAAARTSAGLEEAPGAEPYPPAAEYRALRRRLGALVQGHLPPPEAHLGSRRWPVAGFLALLAHLGLEAVRLDAWGYCQAPDDSRVPADRHRLLRDAEHRREMRWLASLRDGPEGQVLARHGFTRGDLDRLIDLAGIRHRWLLENPLYDWYAGVSLVMAGRKPRPR